MLALLTLLVFNVFARDLVVYTADHPTPSDNGGRSNLEIYWMDLADKTPRQLTKHPSTDHSPTLHPNGKLVAFVTDRWKSSHGGDQLAIATLPEGEVTRLDMGKYRWAWRPRFSADGKYLYFSRAHAPMGDQAMSRYKIVRYDLQMNTLQEMLAEVDGNFLDLAPSPDGQSLAYRFAGNGDQYVRLLDLNNLQSKPLNPARPAFAHEARPSWRGNNTLSVLTEYGERDHYLMWAVHTFSTAGTQPQQILKHRAIYNYDHICWLDDESGVMGAREYVSGSFQLFSFSVNEIQKLSNDETWWSSEPDCRRITL